MKKILLAVIVCFLISSCADVEHVKQCTTGHEYGFFGGLWHGIIAPFAFIGSLFNDDIAVWAVNNNGGWYAFGFLLGIGALGGSTSSATRKSR